MTRKITRAFKAVLAWLDPKPAPLPRILTLQHFLTAAYTAEQAALEPATAFRNKSAAISIVMLDTGADHQYAEINGKAMHYSGSLVKVAALYAAHDLRAAARKHAKDNPFASTAEFISSFAAAINTTTALPKVKAIVAGLKPNLARIFTGFKHSGPDRIEFKTGAGSTKEFQNFLDDIFHNPSAGAVIRALGYSFINVSLMDGGFFDRTTEKGIWLAGDYSGAQTTPTVRVAVENDTVPDGSGQAITTEQMSRMFRMIHLGEAYPHVVDAVERAEANNGVHANLTTRQLSFFFDPRPRPPALMSLSVAPAFAQHCAKVGIGSLGPLKPNGTTDGPSVYSEGAVMVWNNAAEVTAFNTAKQRTLTRDFVLVWQNTYDENPRWNALVRIVNGAIKNFLTQP